MPEKTNSVNDSNKELAVLVGIYPSGGEEECDRSLDELARLLETAGGTELARLTQSRDTPDAKTVVGSGKLAELAELCTANDAKLVIFDCELSPSQIRSIEDALKSSERGSSVDVIDRSMLILDIFADHAVTNEGKLQVELAQLKYTAPRLIGKGKQMSRIGSGSSLHNRGSGESKLELDRRRLKTRAAALEEELSRLDRARRTMRSSRDRSGIAKAAIVGYTNAGKSTLLNRLTDAGILAEDKLFATLDPTTRKFTLPSGLNVLLTDTVGFVRRLPHHLISAFKSTLDEAVYADILIIIADASDDECAEHLEVTAELMKELGASDKPTLYVFNKADKITETELAAAKAGLKRACGSGDAVFISAKTGEGVEALVDRLETLVRAGKTLETFVIPNDKHALIAQLYKSAEVRSVDYGDSAATVTAMTDAKTRGQYAEYIAGSQAG